MSRASRKEYRKPAHKKQGATTKNTANHGLKKGRIFVKIVLFIGVLPAMLVWGYLTVDWSGLQQKVKGATNRPVENIAIRGEFEYLDKRAIQNAVTHALSGNFVDLDLVELKKKLETDPWVYEANLKRVWPSSLEIDVVEQKAIARWGTEGYLNQYGELVLTPIDDRLNNLPRLVGERALSGEMARTYLDVAVLLSKHGLRIQDLKVDNKGSWEIVLVGDLTIVIGQRDMMGKMNNFLYVFNAQLKPYLHRVKKIDLRYENGLAVGWKVKNMSEFNH